MKKLKLELIVPDYVDFTQITDMLGGALKNHLFYNPHDGLAENYNWKTTYRFSLELVLDSDLKGQYDKACFMLKEVEKHENP